MNLNTVFTLLTFLSLPRTKFWIQFFSLQGVWQLYTVWQCTISGVASDCRGLVQYEDLLTLLTCLQCRCLVSPPVAQCRKGHLYCLSCKWEPKMISTNFSRKQENTAAEQLQDLQADLRGRPQPGAGEDGRLDRVALQVRRQRLHWAHLPSKQAPARNPLQVLTFHTLHCNNWQGMIEFVLGFVRLSVNSSDMAVTRFILIRWAGISFQTVALLVLYFLMWSKIQKWCESMCWIYMSATCHKCQTSLAGCLFAQGELLKCDIRHFCWVGKFRSQHGFANFSCDTAADKLSALWKNPSEHSREHPSLSWRCNSARYERNIVKYKRYLQDMIWHQKIFAGYDLKCKRYLQDMIWHHRMCKFAHHPHPNILPAMPRPRTEKSAVTEIVKEREKGGATLWKEKEKEKKKKRKKGRKARREEQPCDQITNECIFICCQD